MFVNLNIMNVKQRNIIGTNSYKMPQVLCNTPLKRDRGSVGWSVAFGLCRAERQQFEPLPTFLQPLILECSYLPSTLYLMSLLSYFVI